MLNNLTVKPSRADLADAALKAATELGFLIKDDTAAHLDRISQFRDVLRRTTDGWLDSETSRLTDGVTARLYLDAFEQSRGSTARSVDEFLSNVRSVLQDFDAIDQKRKDPTALQEMLKFTLALHTLLIGDVYGKLSHWKHKELL